MNKNLCELSVSDNFMFTSNFYEFTSKLTVLKKALYKLDTKLKEVRLKFELKLGVSLIKFSLMDDDGVCPFFNRVDAKSQLICLAIQ